MLSARAERRKKRKKEGRVKGRGREGEKEERGPVREVEGLGEDLNHFYRFSRLKEVE
jgi:hypothetical protein